MKYIDPITKEKKTIYTKASDTLPLGAIVDFDGEEIPAGWEPAPEDATVYIGPNEPTDGQDIWIQKGKNLFDIRNIKPVTTNGLSMTPDVVNNTLNFTGTPTGYTSFILMENFVPKHDFIVSLNGQMKGTTNMMLEVQMYKDGKYVTSAAADYYIGLDEYDFDYCHIALKRNNNVETNDSAQVLVSYVNNASYEPYIDKRIYIKNEEGKYDLFVKNRVYIGLQQPEDGEEVWLQKSKNLVNIQAFNYTTVKAHPALLDYYSVPLYLGKPNAVYCVSTTFLNEYTPAGKSIYILVCPNAEDNNGWVPVAHAGQPPVDGGYYNHQVTSDTNGYVYLRVSKGTTQAKYEEFLANSLVQIELGATSTSYEPYSADKKIHTKSDNGGYEEFCSIPGNLGSAIYSNAAGGNDINLKAFGQGLYWVNTNWGNGFFIWNGTDLDCYCGRTNDGYILDIHSRATGLISAWGLNSEGNIISYPKIYTIIKVSNF